MLFKLETPEHQRTAMRRVVEVHLYPSFGTAKKMAGSSHTPACCLSKLRSSLEAGKKQPRVWQQYVWNVTEMLLYPSFGAPLVFLWSPYGGSASQLRVPSYYLEDFVLPLPHKEKQLEMARHVYQMRQKAKTLQQEGKHLLETSKLEVERMILKGK